MTEKEMVALNNERRQQLTKENKAYYEDMLVYLRTSRIPAIKTEELLLEMLDHLLAAQKEGKRAEDVFGPDPKAYCEEIVETLGRRPFSLKRYVFMFSTMLYVVFFIHAILDGVVMPLLNVFFEVPHVRQGLKVEFLALPFIAAFVVEAVFYLMRKSTFETFGKKLLRSYVPVLLILYVLPLVGFLFILFNFRDDLPVLPITPWMSLLIGAAWYIVHKRLFRNADIA